MRDEHYFIIHSSEDGIQIDGPLTQDEAESRLEIDDEGNCYYGEIKGFHTDVPSQDSGHFYNFGRGDDPSEKLLIIKGAVATPQARPQKITYKL